MSSLSDFSDPQKIVELVFQDVYREVSQSKQPHKISPHLCFVLLTHDAKSSNISLARKAPNSLSKFEPLDWIPYALYLRESLSQDDSECLIGLYFGFVHSNAYYGVFTTPFGYSPRACKKSLDRFKKDVIVLDDPLSQFLFLHNTLDFDTNVKH